MIENRELALNMAYAEKPYIDLVMSNPNISDYEQTTLYRLAKYAGSNAAKAYMLDKGEQTISAYGEMDFDVDTETKLELARGIVVNQHDFLEFAAHSDTSDTTVGHRSIAGTMWSFVQSLNNKNGVIHSDLVFANADASSYGHYGLLDLQLDSLIIFIKKYDDFAVSHPELKPSEIVGRLFSDYKLNFYRSFVDYKLELIKQASKPPVE